MKDRTLSRREILAYSASLLCSFNSHVVNAEASITPYPLEHKLYKNAPKVEQFESLDKFNSVVQRIQNEVSEERVEKLLTKFGSYTSRHLYRSENELFTIALQDYIRSEQIGDRISLDEFVFNNRTRSNVIAEINPNKQSIILLCAHFDSISHTSIDAPGADDNLSGVVALLETLRVLNNLGLTEKRVIFCFFNAEEQGLIGSQNYANKLFSESIPISLVINLDMIGHVQSAARKQIVVEYDSGNVSASNDIPSKLYARRLSELAREHLEFEVENTNIWNSDYMSFEKHGYPCVGLYDKGGEFYHTENDTLDVVSVSKVADVARLVSMMIYDM